MITLLRNPTVATVILLAMCHKIGGLRSRRNIQSIFLSSVLVLFGSILLTQDDDLFAHINSFKHTRTHTHSHSKNSHAHAPSTQFCAFLLLFFLSVVFFILFEAIIDTFLCSGCLFRLLSNSTSSWISTTLTIHVCRICVFLGVSESK